ncbi:MAG: hypothetical protein CSA45_01900 [Gammaproteobacteria bacterium]|nr:MAG: hypothetical protein CSA45_01900 [Gammaproteobacteria bacterium]
MIEHSFNTMSVDMNKALKKQKIINTAIKLFVKNGIHNTSMQMLAKKAGIATGSIYTYFDSKDALVVEAFYCIVNESIAAVKSNYDANQLVKERFYYLLEEKIRFDIKHPEKFKFLGMCSYEPIVMQKIQKNDWENSPLAAVLDDGKKECLLKELPIHDAFYYIFGGIGSLLEWRLFNRKHISDTDITNMIDMAWNAIKQ